VVGINTIIEGATRIRGGSRRRTPSRTQDRREVVSWGAQTAPIGGCHAWPSPCAPRAFRGRHSILKPRAASSLLARRRAPPSFVGYGVQPPLGNGSATPSFACLGSAVAAYPSALGVSHPRGPGVTASPPDTEPRRRSPFGRGAAPPRLRIWEPPPWLWIEEPPVSQPQPWGSVAMPRSREPWMSHVSGWAPRCSHVGGCHRNSWVMACRRRSRMAVRHRLPQERCCCLPACLESVGSWEPRSHHRLRALGPDAARPPIGSRPHRASESRNRRHNSGSRNRRRNRSLGGPPPRALGQPMLSHAPGWASSLVHQGRASKTEP
jgi:hypothetical protein